ncbi:MAG: Nif3-like dinuclear metal center hexameric protein [Clostridia bacterium]|nr:Nif3-like dinuclear metal center hexameric protein [Clostridia bacterium]
MTIRELYGKLSELYPENLRAEWDNDGIMCCDNLDKEVNSVLIALDVTMQTVDYAIENSFDLIISHHPLVFSSQKALTCEHYTQNKLIKLIKNGISVFSFHTRLDAANGGVNDVLCSLLGLQNVQADPCDPVGRLACLSQKYELSTFVENVKNALNTPFVLYNGERAVEKIYVVGGDGKDLISRAISMGADTLLTGRASYNTMIDAKDMNLNIVEAGHFFTENPVCKKIESDVLSIHRTAKTEVFCSYQIKNI